MTTTTPPGWYPEPGHTGNGPAMERWWDGSAWTEYTRTAPPEAAQYFTATGAAYIDADHAAINRNNATARFPRLARD